jgi:aspartyl-tRNA(Asn)/glutamyl-tRNA(Gln) amidotransferase subunit A
VTAIPSGLTDLTLADARAGLRAREFSAGELTQAYITAVEAARPLNAYITETPERALEMAAASDERLKRGVARRLDGIPVAVKDLFCTKGILTTAASHILDGFHPPYESTVTDKLWQAGAVMLGKTNLDEFAMGSSNTTSHYGPVENPWRKPGDNCPLVPGGSSGGSAAAVAAHAALAATGTDTGGSIRQPASFCGIVGLKPTYGPLLALGGRRLCLLARPSRAARPHRAGRGDPARRDGRARSQGLDLGAAAGA